MKSRIVVSIFSLVALTVSAQVLNAQTEAHDHKLRNDCRLATQILRSGHPAPHYDWALEFIPKCEQSGAPVLAALWGQRGMDADFLDRLFLASYRLRDSRLTSALADVAVDRSAPQLVRLNAIRVLAGHAVPHFLISLSDLVRPVSSEARHTFPTVDHVVVREGYSPVTGETIGVIMTALEAGRDDPDPEIARAASRTYRQVSLTLGREP